MKSKTITLSGSLSPVYRGHSDVNEYDGLGDAKSAFLQQGALVTVRNDIKLLMDGQPVSFQEADGNAIDPIERDGVLYLPVRTVAELLGMSATYQPDSKRVYLRTPLTGTQLAECRAYVETLQKQYDAVYPYTTTLTPNGRNPAVSEADKKEIKTIADVREAANACKAILDVLKNTPKPDCKLLDSAYETMQQRVSSAMVCYQTLMQMIDSGESFQKCHDTLRIEGPEIDGSVKALTDWVEFAINGSDRMRIVVNEE